MWEEKRTTENEVVIGLRTKHGLPTDASILESIPVARDLINKGEGGEAATLLLGRTAFTNEAVLRILGSRCDTTAAKIEAIILTDPINGRIN